MKNIITILLIALSVSSFAKDKTGLLIIAHGSPSPKWNQPVLVLENSVKALFAEKQMSGFDEVRVALMEFAEPSVATVVKEMEDKGVTKIYALPLFISPSGHSVFDVPAILGLYYNKEVGDALKEEGTKIVNAKAKITIGPTLNYGDVIEKVLLDRVNELSENPKKEALIILAHGDESFLPIWKNIADKAGNFILGNTGIEYYDKAFVEVGQSFAIDGVSAISAAADNKDKVIVVGIYVSSGAKRITKDSGMIMMGHPITSEAMLKGKNIVYSDKGLLPSPKITEWIVNRAIEWLKQ